MNILVRMIALGSVLATVACAPAKPIRNAIADARPAFVAGPTPDFVSAPVAGATPFPPVAGATPFLPWRVLRLSQMERMRCLLATASLSPSAGALTRLR